MVSFNRAYQPRVIRATGPCEDQHHQSMLPRRTLEGGLQLDGTPLFAVSQKRYSSAPAVEDPVSFGRDRNEAAALV